MRFLTYFGIDALVACICWFFVQEIK